MGNIILENAEIILPIMAQAHEAVAYALSDTEKNLYKHERNFSVPGVIIGENLDPQSPANLCQAQRKMIHIDLPAEIFGVAMRSTGIPLFDDQDPDKIVGCLGIAFPRDNAVQLKRLTDIMSSSMQEISAAVEDTATSAGNINSGERRLSEAIADINNAAEKIIEILKFITDIASQTKMLGLNAAIEAARAGESGRGFGVVSEEIRKLSDQSKDVAQQIASLISEIQSLVQSAQQVSLENLKASEDQAAATQQITASIQELNGQANQLDIVAQRI